MVVVLRDGGGFTFGKWERANSSFNKRDDGTDDPSNHEDYSHQLDLLHPVGIFADELCSVF